MRLTKPLTALAATAALTVAAAAPASAIRYGQPDNNQHPFVGLMVAGTIDESGEFVPQWRCSGTLVDPTHFLTAGHCTFGADAVEVWFEEDVNDRAVSGYPFGGPTSISGTPYTHPDYDDDAFYLNDLGMVVLDEAVELDEYGELPELGYFDQFFVKRGQNKQLFTAVGYGLQRSMPAQTGLTEASLERRQATLRIINQDAAFGEKKAGNSVLFTNNAATGGTCSGDSGGPIFVQGTTTIAAVTSYGLNARCAGTGGGYRVDTADDLDWLAEDFGLFPGQNW
jgi:secreted trypsin-like serine protease